MFEILVIICIAVVLLQIISLHRRINSLRKSLKNLSEDMDTRFRRHIEYINEATKILGDRISEIKEEDNK